MRVGLAVLAAGSGSRAGGCKQARRLCGRPLLEWSLRAGLGVDADIRLVVVGACLCALGRVEPRVLAAYRVVFNPWWREGMASSVRIAASTLLSEGVDAALIIHGDMPLVSPGLLSRLLETVRSGAEAAYTSHRGVRGPPAAFRGRVLRLMINLRGDRGPGALWGKLRAALVEPASPEEIMDVDTLEDFERVTRLLCNRI